MSTQFAKLPAEASDESPRVLPRALAAARRAQADWAATPLRKRLELVRRFRTSLCGRGEALATTLELPQRRSVGESWTSEIVPLAEACRFLERESAALLAPRRVGVRGRPLWLWGSHAEVHREPLGLVLVLGPANYPLLLPGVQTLQALAAGNAVALKPGRGGGRVLQSFRELLIEAGLDARLLPLLDESTAAGEAAVEIGVDKVLLTGSAGAGRAVLSSLADKLIPATLELSGSDAVFVLPGADLDLVVRAIVFGLTLNSGQTCIAPRRVFADAQTLAALTPKLARALDCLAPLPLDPARTPALRAAVQDALTHGAHRVAGNFVSERQIVPICIADVRPEMELARIDVFAPLVMLLAAETSDQALAASAVCPYALGATVFGPEPVARHFAARVAAGVVVINDMIAPTGDPRLPFGGRGESGYGVTRGAEGLLELTRPKVVIHRRGRFRPHLNPVANEAELAQAYLQATHAGRWRLRLAGWGRLLRALVASRAPSTSSPARSVQDV